MLKKERAWLAVCIMLDVAFFAGRGRTVPGAEVADRLGESRRGIEPVLQALARGGLLASTRGPKGGYRLARPARDIGLDMITRAIVDPADPADPGPVPAGGLRALVAEPLWTELEAGLEKILAGMTLADLLARAAAAGMQRPAAGPLNFAI
ncbi:BadM/Rrf2 family transcriptional regulator [Humitalea rosea]|uniref:BadM/Rrf2 family transcriptional regulator n=1 Tax=Humitalea rosea TaxID=990373 RepID=A0A2W7JBK1_9PROT|nr:Rrf2 family transcriptional regulator [Humitalea rosea]PZW49071.1 BadM/Rrf2 family transcriptional regulator [Humitalea rosea]